MNVLYMTLKNLVTLELCGMRSTSTLPSLPGLLWSGVVAPDRILSMGQIEVNCVLMLLTDKRCNYAKLNCLKQNDFGY